MGVQGRATKLQGRQPGTVDETMRWNTIVCRRCPRQLVHGAYRDRKPFLPSRHPKVAFKHLGAWFSGTLWDLDLTKAYY